MMNNPYDVDEFFNKYKEMARSQFGLEAAGEWPQMKELLPPLQGLQILDLGCGYGWHCAYFSDQGAQSIIGIDISKKMIDYAKEINSRDNIDYSNGTFDDFTSLECNYDLIFSSLAIHYIDDFSKLSKDVFSTLNPGGSFLFSVEHPVFTAEGSQQWIMGEDMIPLYWPVDRYYDESWRTSKFLGSDIKKYHRTLSSYINTLIGDGFQIDAVTEVIPPHEWVILDERNKDEMRRPMMLIVKATKK